jgi:lysophospholipase L1-like esterase
MAIFIPKNKRNKFGVERRWREAGSSAGASLFRAWIWFKSRGSSVLWKAFMVIFLLFSCYAVFLRPNPNDPFARPFCDSNGVCHEKPDLSSPRTPYSAWNKEQYDLWWTYYETLEKRVDKYAKKRQKLYESEEDYNEYSNRTRPLILLGDSITEAWSGTGLGIPKVRAEGVAQVLEELSSSLGLDPVVLAMAGDQTQHLLYRLENNHMRAAQLSIPSNKDGKSVVAYDPSAVFVVMIGTNNLGSGELPEPTAGGVLAVADYLLRETAEAGCDVMLFQVLPRGDAYTNLPKLCPPRCSDDETKTPYSSFLPAIDKVNMAVAKGIETLIETYSDRIKLVDCGSEFVNEEYDDEQDQDTQHVKRGNNKNYEVKKELMPDLLHPNAMGHRHLANCIRDYINQIDPKK